MKLLVIPDVHGISEWQSQVNNAILFKDTHIVFLGDYVDSYEIGGWEILENLKDIIDLKKRYPTKVTLLLGNHDYAYIFGKIGISGFNFHMWLDYRQLFNDNWQLFDIAWGFQGKDRYTLLTHAGLTQSFYDTLVKDINNPDSIMHDILVLEGDEPWQKLPLHELLNYFIDQAHTMWQIGIYRRGTSPTGSILWADKQELTNDRYKDIDQIVGHTASPHCEIKFIDGDKLYFVDTHNERQNTITGFLIELI